MIISEIGVRLGYKVNMGEYETLDIDYSIKAQLEKGDDPEEVHQKLYEFTNKKVGEEMAKARAASRVNTVRRKAGKVEN